MYNENNNNENQYETSSDHEVKADLNVGIDEVSPDGFVRRNALTIFLAAGAIALFIVFIMGSTGNMFQANLIASNDGENKSADQEKSKDVKAVKDFLNEKPTVIDAVDNKKVVIPAPKTVPTPAVSTPTPAVSTPTPAVSTPTPAVSTPTPAVSTPTPAVSTPTPAVSTPTPAVSTPTPAVSTPKIIVNPNQNIIDTTTGNINLLNPDNVNTAGATTIRDYQKLSGELGQATYSQEVVNLNPPVINITNAVAPIVASNKIRPKTLAASGPAEDLALILALFILGGLFYRNAHKSKTFRI